ncbi:MAG: hypothetical protein GVY17_15545 [Cyanobacteria bacterium]|jgi:hypothetical protein|nr:hypothetical protein [Cyanobacteria bacterium GSL.Bin21]
MRHPFDLENSHLETVDLDFLEPLTDETTQPLAGGSMGVTTQAIGEEGGTSPNLFPFPLSFLDKLRPPYPFNPSDPPKVTTLALGEEGG